MSCFPSSSWSLLWCLHDYLSEVGGTDFCLHRLILSGKVLWQVQFQGTIEIQGSHGRHGSVEVQGPTYQAWCWGTLEVCSGHCQQGTGVPQRPEITMAGVILPESQSRYGQCSTARSLEPTMTSMALGHPEQAAAKGCAEWSPQHQPDRSTYQRLSLLLTPKAWAGLCDTSWCQCGSGDSGHED